MSRGIKCIISNKGFKELYGVVNDACPLCKKEFIVPGNLVIVENIAYDLNCFFELTNRRLEKEGNKWILLF